VTAVMAWMTLDPVPVLILRSGLALLLLFAGLHKLRDRAGFRSALAGYDLVPRAGLRAMAVVLIGVELVVGAGLLWPGSGPAPAAGATILLGSYTAAIAAALLRGRRVDCGCGGPAGGARLSWALVGRNAVLLAGALAATAAPGDRPLLWLDGVTVCLGLATLVFTYVAADTALANADRLRALGAAAVNDAPTGAVESEELSWSTP